MATETTAQANLDFRQQLSDKLSQLRSRVDEDFSRCSQIEQSGGLIVSAVVPSKAIENMGQARLLLSQVKLYLQTAASELDQRSTPEVGST